MTFKAILTPVTGRSEDAEALDAALQLSAACDAAVTVLPAYTDLATDLTLPSEMPLSAEVADKLRDLEIGWNAEIVRLTEAAKTRLHASGQSLSAGVRIATPEGGRWLSLMKHIPLTDITVMAWAGARDAAALGGVLSDLLFTLKAPVLLARGEEPVVDRVAAVAWDNSPEAGRAVRAALPLLRKARSVTILQDPDGLNWQQQGGASPFRLVDYLALHGVQGVSVREARGHREGPALIEAAQAAGAAILVSGAYSHHPIQEWIFGGATRSFLGLPAGPHLFLAH